MAGKIIDLETFKDQHSACLRSIFFQQITTKLMPTSELCGRDGENRFKHTGIPYSTRQFTGFPVRKFSRNQNKYFNQEIDVLNSEQELTGLLRQVKTIAIVGAVDRPGRPVDRVGRYLIEAGFNVIPVHPKREDVWGLITYPTLKDIPFPVDLVNLFRNAEQCPEHALEALTLLPLPRGFWMQTGIVSQKATEILKGHPIVVVQDRCIMVDHRELLGASQ